MRVLFFFRSDFSTIPLGIMTLSAILKENGHVCDLIDTRFEPDFIKATIDFKPDIVAYSIVSFTWNYYQKLNIQIKKHVKAISVFGGAHCITYPDFINEEGVDAMCVGEGEDAILELVNKIENSNDITDIPNMWIKQDGIIFKNELRNLVPNLDSLPFPDYDLINKYPFYRNSAVYYIMTTRGCPYKCSYCINHFYRKLYKDKGKYVRRRSIENVIQELLIAKNKYKSKLIIFNDDIFTLDEEWLELFAKRYKEEISIPFDAYTRVDTIDENTISILADMGCVSLYFGIESGNTEIRKNILYRNISNEQIIKAGLLIKKHKIKSLSFNMLNLPGETLKEAFETIDINNKSKVDYPMGFIFQPFPNIDLTEYAIKLNLLNSTTKSFKNSLIHGTGLILNKDRIKLCRLRYFFIIACKFKGTIPIIKLLIKFPLDPLYLIVLTISRGIVLTFTMHRPSIKHVFYHYLIFAPYIKIAGFTSRINRKIRTSIS